MEVCTVWLAIDPSLRANGCMRVIPRTHASGRRGFSDYGDVDTERNVFSTEILPVQREEARAVDIELQPNQCSLPDARIMHGSEPNTSRLRRCGWTLRFFPTTCRFDHENFGRYHKIFLARCVDRAGNEYGDPTRAYPELAAIRATKVKNSH